MNCPRQPRSTSSASLSRRPSMYSGRRPGLFRIVIDLPAKHTGDRRLLDHTPIIAAVQIVQDAADDTRILDQRQQVAAGAFITRPGLKTQSSRPVEIR